MNEVWRVGNVKVSRVVELEVTGGSRFILPDATRDQCLPLEWMHPHFMDEAGNLIMSVHALVVDTGEHRIVVDTCIGNDKERSMPAWSNLQTSFLKHLIKTGYEPETIDLVLCTHLHVDHVGWNTRYVDGEWVPTFPNAEYLVASDEWQYWTSEPESGRFDEVYADSVKPIEPLMRLIDVDSDAEIVPGITLKPTPGHTPGHVSVEIQSKGQSAIITGDCIHHPCQMTRVEWCSSADTDAALGLDTRSQLLAGLCDSQTLVIGTHFASPTAGYIRPHVDGQYWLDTAIEPN